MKGEEAGTKMQKEEPRNTQQQTDTSAFEKELNATLRWLTEESPSAHPFGDCPETEAIVSHLRGNPRPELEEHLKNCQKCSDLASYMHRRESVYKRQRDYFLKQLEAEPIKEPWWTSAREVLRQTFRPFAFLLEGKAMATASILALALCIGVWLLPSFVAMIRPSSSALPFDAKGLSTSGKIENYYGLIEKASPTNPGAAEIALDDLRRATQTGGMVKPTTPDAALASVRLKKTEAPDKSDDWTRIQNELEGYALLNRYAYLRSERQMGAPLWKDFAGVSKEDNTLLIFLNREPSYDTDTYKLLKESRQSTKGINGVLLVTPSNRKVPIG